MFLLGAAGKYKAYLERRDQEIDGHLSETQNEAVLRRLVQHKHKDHLVDAQQRDEAQRGLGQPTKDGEEENRHGGGWKVRFGGVDYLVKHNTWLSPNLKMYLNL